MTRSKLVIVPLAAVLALMPTSGSAIGRESVSEPLVTTEITTDTPYTAADVSERAAHLDVSLNEADLRLRLERASIGIEPMLIEAFPDTFAGMWLETEGSPGLTVALTKGAEAALPVIRSMFAIPEAVRTVGVEHSLADLLALQRRLMLDRSALQAEALPLVHALAPTGGNYDLDVDTHRNTVVVHLEDRTDALASAFAELYGTEMLTVEGNRGSPHCSISDCRYTLRGGLRVEDRYGSDCTSGFSAVSGSTYFMLSAAHCSSAPARHHAGEYYGSVDRELEYGRVDAERHYRPWPSPWYISASILVDSTDIRPIRYHISWENTARGTWVGKSGEETGTTRGHITSKYHSPWWVADSNRFLKAEYCTEVGDSGGPVFNTNTAYGINSGGVECSHPDAWGTFGNVVYAKDALGVSILASP